MSVPAAQTAIPASPPATPETPPTPPRESRSSGPAVAPVPVEFYEHSGRCGALGVPLTLALGGGAALVLAVAYDYAINWIPFIYINFFATIGLGVGVGLAAGFGGRLGNIRNNMIVAVLGGCCGIAALYFAWVFDPLARIGGNDGFVAWNPALLWEYISFGYENGFWAIGRRAGQGGGQNVSGIFLGLVWLIEAIIIVGGAGISTLALTASQPFCEHLAQWTKTETDVSRLSLDGPAEAALARVCQGDLGALATFYRADSEEPAHLRLDLAGTDGCDDCNFLSATLVRQVTDKDGKTEEQSETVFTNLKIRAEHLSLVRNAGCQRPADDSAAVQAKTDEPPQPDDFNFG